MTNCSKERLIEVTVLITQPQRDNYLKSKSSIVITAYQNIKENAQWLYSFGF
jgi:hypothetical protein